MLISLHVKNLALIDETEVLFQRGLNILTGETGAGKSIIMGSVNLALGGKADKRLIRTGADFALVQLVFQVTTKEQEELLSQMDIPLEEDKTVIILRKLLPERSLCKINGVTISQRQLKELASLFINIHGQHETQNLLNIKQYSQILDEYGGEKHEKLKQDVRLSFKHYQNLLNELEEAKAGEKEKVREISLAEYEIKEIEEANLQRGEDEQLEEDFRRMVNAKRIAEHIGSVYEGTGYSGKNSAGDSIGRAVKELKQALYYDNSLEDLSQQLSEIEALLNDFNRSLSEYQKELEFEPAQFEQVEKRLNTYHHLKEKYGNSVEEILEYKSEKEALLERLYDFDAYLQHLTEQKEQAYDDLLTQCKKLSDSRKKYGKTLEKQLKKALVDLNFLSVELQITIEEDRKKITAEGYDSVDFMISLNPGEPVKSMSKVASGGELSRIMLALKAVMADREKIPTLIFDEIDSGISGKTAWKVSEKMAVLGKEHQLICITHLPQIAAMADTHFMIEKSTKKGRSVTEIFKLKEENSLEEIARLLSGTSVTEAVLSNARELKELANKAKNI